MYFLKNKAFTYFLLILAILVGGYMMNTTPKELYPEIKIPVVVVSTVYPGASARDVEDGVTDKLEDTLVGGLKNVDEITSSSKEGVSVISVQFQDDVDIKEALIDVQDRVDEKVAELPVDAEEPIIKKVNFSDQPIFTFALSSTEAYNLLRAKAEGIKERLLEIPGVSSVDIDGIPEREITVLLDPEKLSQFNISPQTVVNAISSSKRTFPAGSIIVQDREYRISYDSQVDTVEDLHGVVVSSLGSSNNIYLRDLMLLIEDGISQYDTQSRIGPQSNATQQAIIFNIKKQEGGNIIELTSAIKKVLENYQNEHVAEQLDFVTIFDAGKDIQTNLSELIGSGIQTVLIILVVMGLMVGFRESIIAAIAIPLSFLLTFIGMHFMGQTINFITLFSLILVIGILIDSAIVIVEGIYDFSNEGDSFYEAAKKTLKEFTKPVIAGVLTTMSIFVPLMMLSGMLGQFIGGIPRVINIVLIMSLVVALIFIPAVARLLYRFKIQDPKLLVKKRNQAFNWLTQNYRNFLSKLIHNSKKKRRIVWSLIGLLIFSFVLVGSGLIRSEFFPPDNVDKAYVNIEMRQGTSLEKTAQSIVDVERIVAQQEHVIAFTTTIGAENVFVGQGRSGSHFANVVINLDDKKNGNKATSAIRDALSIIDEYKVQVLVPESGPPVGAPFQVKIQGESWDALNTTAEELATLIRSIPAARNVESGVDVGSTEIKLHVVRDRLAEYGLTAFDVSSLLRTTIYGSKATSLRLGNEGDIDVVVKVALDPEAKSHRESNHVTYNQIKNIPIQTMRGEVLLGYFVQERIEQATSTAVHVDGYKNRTVTSYVKDGFLPVDIVTAFEEKVADFDFPEGVSYRLAGADDESSEASSELLASLLLGLLLIFGVLIWQFGSIRDVLFIVSVIPLGLIGVLYGLFFSGMTLSFTAMLGFIALVGVVVNDSIILVDVMNKIRIREPELSKREVVMKGASMRLRPVILTTITTVLGMVPLLFVSPMWKPFAFSMIVGLSFATILTLVIIPIFYEKWSK